MHLWRRLLGEARTRISISYVVLILFFTGVSIPVIYRLLFTRVQERIERSVNQEVEEFQRLINGQDPRTGEPFGKDAKAIFEVFLARNIPGDDEFLLTLIDGQLYAYSPRQLPVSLEPGSDLIRTWARAQEPVQGTVITTDGPIVYRLEPLIIDQEWLGVFAVAHTTAREQDEVNQATLIIVQVMFAVFMLSVVLAWLVAGKVLAPLKVLTSTARLIGESDLSQRIPVQGSGDLAELATTFNEMMDRLQAAFASQRNFIDDAGHELRTPITIIRGHLELMGHDPEEQQETRILLLDELDRMSRFVEDLILLAKAEQSDFLYQETIDVAVLTEELLTKGKALALRDWQIDQVAKGKIVGDRQRITQAMMNLAQNATQHTQVGDTIAFGSSIGLSTVHFWVRDTGSGVAPSDQERIFERFARAANQQRRSDGAGLGLSIVRAIAESHGGYVQLHTPPEGGAIFTITLPLEPDQRPTYASHLNS
ncbi:MAG: sensor histidine kinase [Leptolyngbya sp. DLM2.Bin15]|nr:MAG: sensor histidine kinase [Leptolyngbya sp. DLM2.Bin15]